MLEVPHLLKHLVRQGVQPVCGASPVPAAPQFAPCRTHRLLEQGQLLQEFEVCEMGQKLHVLCHFAIPRHRDQKVEGRERACQRATAVLGKR